MIYDIVNVKFKHPSFSWENGLYAVIEKTETVLRMCQLDKNFNPHLFDDGRFVIIGTCANNKDIYLTPLKLHYDICNKTKHLSSALNPLVDVGGEIIDLRKIERVGKLEGDSSWLTYSVYCTSGRRIEIYHERKYADNKELRQMKREKFVELWLSINKGEIKENEQIATIRKCSPSLESYEHYFYMGYKCPNCAKRGVSPLHDNYCPNCGIKINWIE
jgi:DNA-directed RNA polymerase subunit RPC12/RpoP